MYMIPCFVNIKPDLPVHPQPWSCICDICLFTHGLAFVINLDLITFWTRQESRVRTLVLDKR